MKGIYTIHIENIDTGEERIITKENAINPFIKRFAHPEISFDKLVIAPESVLPVVDEAGNITLESKYLLYSSTSGIGSSAGNIFSTYGLKNNSLSKDSEYIDEIEGKVSEYHTTYFQGPFLLGGLMIYSDDYSAYARWGGWSTTTFYLRVNRLMSALNIEPNITIESNERVYLHYKLIREWY